jgi:hypothetical protein
MQDKYGHILKNIYACEHFGSISGSAEKDRAALPAHACWLFLRPETKGLQN